MVQNFAEENALTLNPAKCDVLIVSPSKLAPPTPVCTIADQSLFPKILQTARSLNKIVSVDICGEESEEDVQTYTTPQTDVDPSGMAETTGGATSAQEPLSK